MRLSRLVLLGVALTLAGLFWIYTKVMWAVMVGHTCEGYWDTDGCQGLLLHTYMSIIAPGPGIGVLIVCARRWITRRRRLSAASAPHAEGITYR